jgi:hypothetical protein
MEKLMEQKYSDLNCQPFVLAAAFKTNADKMTTKLDRIIVTTECKETILSQKETEWIKKWFTEVRDCVGDFDYYKGEEMTDQEWNVFKEKIT